MPPVPEELFVARNTMLKSLGAVIGLSTVAFILMILVMIGRTNFHWGWSMLLSMFTFLCVRLIFIPDFNAKSANYVALLESYNGKIFKENGQEILKDKKDEEKKDD